MRKMTRTTSSTQTIFSCSDSASHLFGAIRSMLRAEIRGLWTANQLHFKAGGTPRECGGNSAKNGRRRNARIFLRVYSTLDTRDLQYSTCRGKQFMRISQPVTTLLRARQISDKNKRPMMAVGRPILLFSVIFLAPFASAQASTTFHFDAYIKALFPSENAFFGEQRALDMVENVPVWDNAKIRRVTRVVVGATGDFTPMSGVFNRPNATLFRGLMANASSSLSGSGAAWILERTEDETSNVSAPNGTVFEQQTRGEWTFVAYLKAGFPRVGDDFGRAVSISGDTVLVGAPFEDSKWSGIYHLSANETGVGTVPNPSSFNASLGGPNSGAAYLYKRDPQSGNWVWAAYIKSPAPPQVAAGDWLGSSVVLRGTRAVIAVRREDSSTSGITTDFSNPLTWNTQKKDSGAAFVLAYNASASNWQFEAFVKTPVVSAQEFRFQFPCDFSSVSRIYDRPHLELID
jgi:FG-GAP repeat